MSEKTISPNGIYEFILPNGYEVEADGETIVICDNDKGSGAIRISCYKIPDNYPFEIEAELKDFISSIDNNYNKLGDLGIKLLNPKHAFSEFSAHEYFWRVWVLFRRPHAVFITYNCLKNEQDREKEKIDGIMKSFRIIN